ncbi:MAG TPA: hypothetical protein VGG35_10225 [Streptosporangiaceae bacterium]
MTGDPFRRLGLPASASVSDDDVRAAWRRVAAATHPDRADGGDPAAFAAAAAAYSDLRTAFGRGEALAGLIVRHPARPARPVRLIRLYSRPGWARRVSEGRPSRLALRLLVVAILGSAVVTVNGWRPATPALLTGLAVWLVRAGRRDLAAAAISRRTADAAAPTPGPAPPGPDCAGSR